jgi:hypothetical protein
MATFSHLNLDVRLQKRRARAGALHPDRSGNRHSLLAYISII